MKPVELVERAIRNSSKARDTILDVFGVQYDALIACEKSGRLARLIDLEPNYCDVIIQRWQQFSGGTARHAVSGQCFNEAAVREPATAFQQAREVSV